MKRYLKMKNRKVKAFTMTELMVVLAIIGILTILAIPIYQNVFGDTYAIEAKTQLKFLQTRQQMYYQTKFRYSTDLNQVGFVAPKTILQDGEAKYSYEVVQATPHGFKARAEAVVDFDKDGVHNVWEIDQDGKLEQVVPD